MGVPLEYLIAASSWLPRRAGCCSLLMVLETEQTHDKDDAMKLIAEEDRPANVIDAGGFRRGLRYAVGAGTSVRCCWRLSRVIALLNGTLGGIGGGWSIIRSCRLN